MTTEEDKSFPNQVAVYCKGCNYLTMKSVWNFWDSDHKGLSEIESLITKVSLVYIKISVANSC